MIDIRDGRPWLSKGPHRPDAREHCLVEFLSRATDARHSSWPTFIDPVIRCVAVAANDDADDEDRQRLLTVIPDILACGTLPTDAALRVWRRLVSQDTASSDPLVVRGWAVERLLGQAAVEEVEPVGWVEDVCSRWQKICADEGAMAEVSRVSYDTEARVIALAMGTR